MELRDGTAISGGTINQSSTPPASGDTSITVHNGTTAIVAGSLMTIVGSTRTYTVVSSVGGSSPTSITFSPALATADGVPTNGAAVTIGPKNLYVKIGEGNLTYDLKQNMEYVRDRRQIAFVRTGDQDACDISLDFIWEFLASESDATTPTIEEVFLHTGPAASWVTSGSDPCEPYAVAISVTYTPPCSGVLNEQILIPEFRYESLKHDLKAGTVAVSGKSKVNPIHHRGV